MRINGLVLEYNGTMAFADGSVGIFHTQGEWSDATGEIVWSVDPVESRNTFNSPGTLSGYTMQITQTIALDNNQTFVSGQWFDGRYWALVGDDDPDDLIDNAENVLVIPDVVDHMHELIGL
jgi:hypothetical protein